MRFRDYKNFAQGEFYHVYNRGNNKQDIFLEKADYYYFLFRLKTILGFVPNSNRVALETRATLLNRFKPDDFHIHSYCLMPNHFHFLIQQNTEIPVSKLIGKLCTIYSIYFNKKYNRVGSLFQDRFKAKHIDSETYLLKLSAYIHNNPENPLGYEFSSFPDYVYERSGQITYKNLLTMMFNSNSEEYKNFVLGYSGEDNLIIKDLLFEED